MSTLFEDFPSEKDQSEILPLDQQICTQYFYFTTASLKEFKALMKVAIPELLEGQPEEKWNLSNGIIALLKKHYGETH